jgi:2-C-methyl-D-erythritol 4-phosphate cytidylyltransferase
MGAAQTKQYMLLNGVPVLTRTLRAFMVSGLVDAICLVVPETDFSYCRREILPFAGNHVPVILAPGGKTRQESVYQGLSAISGTSEIVLIHDGVRPFFPVAAARQAIGHARDEGACILGIPLTDTLKILDPEGYIGQTLPRRELWRAQTPQVFARDLVQNAHDRAILEKFTGTDDASLVERMGGRVRMIYGSPYNIKITIPEDLVIARAILEKFPEKFA